MNDSRRNFIKVGALIGATAPLMGANLSLLEKKEIVTSGTHWALSEVTIKNGVIISNKPIKEDRHPSLMEKSLISRTYNQTRVEYPYVREGFLKNRGKSDTSKRGAEKFIRVSWDEVNQIIYEEMIRVRKEHGERAIYAGSYGWQGLGKLHSARTLLKRMLNATETPFVDSLGNYSNAAVSVIASHTIGTSQYHKHTSLDLIAKHTDNLFLFGCDLLKTNQLDWVGTLHEAYPEFDKLSKASINGKVNVISIDPLETDTSKYLNAKTVKLVPNTDVALLLGIAHYIYTNDLHDKTFIKRYTVGFDKFAEYIMGKEDGIEKTPAWASKITSLSERDIVTLAKIMLKGRTMFMTGWSMQRGDHGEQPNWIIFTLSSMLGQIGKNGGGFGSSYHYSSYGSSVNKGVGISGITSLRPNKAYHDAIPVARITDMLANPGKTIDYNGKKITYADVKMSWWAGGNPMHHHQDRNQMLKAWQKLEVVIHQDIFWNASSRMADIILPVASEIERNDISNVGSTSNMGFIAMKQGIQPVGESKSDFDIFKDISAKFGKEKVFTDGKTEMQWVEGFYNKSRSQGEARNIKLPLFKEFWEKGFISFDQKTSNSDSYNAFEEFIKDPLENPLGTPSGKIEIFSREIDSYKYDDCKGHATWFEPAEYLGNRTKKHPFHLLSPHPKFRLHSQLDNTIMREVYSVQGREPIFINPKNAKEKGIKDGDLVMVHNSRGKVLAGAVVTNDIRVDVLVMHEGGWYDPVEPGKEGTMCAHGDVNLVTLDKSTSKLAQANIANTTLVDIEKFKGTVPPIKVFSKPNLG